MDFFHKKAKRRRRIRIALGIVLVIILVIGAGIVWIAKSDAGQEFVIDQVQKQLPDEHASLVRLLPSSLGFDEPRTYLLLFQNNTELRPGGGFIGSYAVLKVIDGQMEILQVQGSEVLDNAAPKDWFVQPPAPIIDYLGIPKWYFRDSNWSPDFQVNAKRALAFFAAEGGKAADQIDTVVAITPTVLENLLEVTGPITVDGFTFDKDNVVELLQYETSYGFENRNIEFTDRKQILKPFFGAVVSKIQSDLFPGYQKYLSLFSKLGEQEHVLVYSNRTDVQTTMKALGLTGEVQYTNGDYLLWVDANLAALKTDHAMKRNLSYNIVGKQDGRYIAKTTMTYIHQGTFDWRTTRYLTYARIFVPSGAEIIDVDGKLRSGADIMLAEVDTGAELEKQWFGTYFSIEPGNTKELSFTYLLPERITSQIEKGQYGLLVDKQLGTLDHKLTLNLDFDISIKAASPAEEEIHWGDDIYQVQSDLQEDRAFMVGF